MCKMFNYRRDPTKLDKIKPNPNFSNGENLLLNQLFESFIC